MCARVLYRTWLTLADAVVDANLDYGMYEILCQCNAYLCIFLDSPRDLHTKAVIYRHFVRPRPSNAIKMKIDRKAFCFFITMFEWSKQRCLQISELLQILEH